MMRALLCSAALLGFATVCVAADAKDPKTNKNENETSATIAKVDATKHTLTVTMKDKNGKEEEKTLDLTKDVKLVDENDKAITLGAFKTGDAVTLTERDGKLVEVEREKAKGTTAKSGEEATITNVDAKKGTITLKMKDKDGKQVERTFTLAEDARYFDSTGNVAALDVFRSGNEVLIIEEEGKLKQVQQKSPEKKDPTK